MYSTGLGGFFETNLRVYDGRSFEGRYCPEIWVIWRRLAALGEAIRCYDGGW